MLRIAIKSLNKPKIIYTTLIILLITSFTFYILKEKEKSLRIAAEKELNMTIEAKITTEKELNRAVEGKRIVENNLQEAKKEITKRDELIELALNKLEKEVVVRKEIEAQLVTVVKEKQNLVTQIEELVAKVPIDIELEKIIIKASSELRGKVLSYDREHTFVTIDLGSRDNLQLGEVLSVYRDNKFIGKIQIEKLENEASAAVVLTPWKNVEYKEKDVVRKI